MPVFLFFLMLAVCGIYPFGVESFLTEDLKYQYIDFFAWLRKVLLGEASIFYAPNLSLGSNTWGIFSYYLSSPLNLLVVFFDEAHLTDFVVLITALKLGLTNLSMSFYLRRRFTLSKLFIAMLAICYTCSLWTVTQMRNPMWLDVLIFLPLILYGVHRLITKSAWKFLLFSAFGAVITCWYTAYMVLLFALFFFVYELFLYGQEHTLSKRVILEKILKCGGVLGGALLLSAFTFLPTVLSVAGSGQPVALEYLQMSGLRDLYSSLFFGNWIRDIIPQNFFGMGILLLVGVFFCIKEIPLKIKIVTAAFIAFMIGSSWLAPLSFVWCGLRVPNGFYCRFAFLTAFLFVFVAAFAAERIQKKEVLSREILYAAVSLSGLALLGLLVGAFVRLEYFFFTMGVVVFTGCLFFVLEKKAVKRPRLQQVILGFLLMFTCGELLFSGHLALPQLYQGYLQKDYGVYLEESSLQLAELRSFDDGLYRIDKTYTRADATALNEGLAAGYLQLSSYSSASNKAAVNFLSSLGYSNEGETFMRYTSPIGVSDSLLGLKYTSSKEKPAGFADAGLGETHNGMKFYQNPYALSLGYLADENILDASLDVYENPFKRQNAFLSALLGQEKEYFVAASVEQMIDSSDLQEWRVVIPEGSIGYTYVESDSLDLVWLTVDDKEPFLENWWVSHCIRELGSSKEKTEYVVSLTSAEEPREGSLRVPELHESDTCYFYYLDVAAFEEAIEVLAANQFEFDVLEGNHANGSFFAEEDSLLLLTIPNEKGWSIEINGVKTEPLDAFGGALMVLPVSAGANEVVMNYLSPGFMPGCIISGITLLLIGALIARERHLRVLRRSENKQPTPTNAAGKHKELE